MQQQWHQCEVNNKGVGKGGAEAPPQILTHVTLLQKNLEKQEREKKQLSGYKHAALRHFQPTCMV